MEFGETILPYWLQGKQYASGCKVSNTLMIMPQDACIEKDMIVSLCVYLSVCL